MPTKTFGRRYALFFMGCLLIAASPLSASDVHVPFVLGEPLPAVRAEVDGHAVLMAIDTGAPPVALSRQFVRKYGLKMRRKGTAMFPGGRSAPILRTPPLSVSIAGVTVGRFVGDVIPRNLPTRGPRIDGVFGTGFLMHFRPTIDYFHHELRLAPADQPMRGSFSIKVPMRVVSDHYIFVDGIVNGVPMTLNVDSGGTDFGIQLTKAALAAAHISAAPDTSHAFMTPAGPIHASTFAATVAIGSAVQQSVAGVYLPGGNRYRIFPFKVDGAISSGFLDHYEVTLDFKNSRLILR